MIENVSVMGFWNSAQSLADVEWLEVGVLMYRSIASALGMP